MVTPSSTHAIVIPSFNTGSRLAGTVREALAHWVPIFVVIDGSTDGSGDALESNGHLTVIRFEQNRGKGAAVLAGVRAAADRGFTHVLAMDSDGQHPAEAIGRFMEISAKNPNAVILGEPVFDAAAPALRVKGRRISNWWANLETLWMGIHDSLFGFRVYPVAPFLNVMDGIRWARRFDFNAEVAVRLCWKGVPIVNVPTPVKYLTAGEGGVSQFRYVRDNALLTWMHTRLMLGFFVRFPILLARRLGRAKP